ncbi:MAG: hypothetical protein JOZ25_09495, partial [Actinobacteria bacterium]|nr:hypothetical protein [Actinomycetota bacterium]
MPFFSRPPITRSKPRRRREDGDALPTLSFDVESVEFVPAGEEIGLLRLAGRWVAPAERVLHEVSLVAADGGELTHVQPLPDPSGSVPTAAPDGRAWRAAFSMNTAVALGESSAFMLRVGAEESVRLPRPGDMPEIE